MKHWPRFASVLLVFHERIQGPKWPPVERSLKSISNRQEFHFSNPKEFRKVFRPSLPNRNLCNRMILRDRRAPKVLWRHPVLLPEYLKQSSRSFVRCSMKFEENWPSLLTPHVFGILWPRRWLISTLPRATVDVAMSRTKLSPFFPGAPKALNFKFSHIEIEGKQKQNNINQHWICSWKTKNHQTNEIFRFHRTNKPKDWFFDRVGTTNGLVFVNWNKRKKNTSRSNGHMPFRKSEVNKRLSQLNFDPTLWLNNNQRCRNDSIDEP